MRRRRTVERFWMRGIRRMPVYYIHGNVHLYFFTVNKPVRIAAYHGHLQSAPQLRVECLQMQIFPVFRSNRLSSSICTWVNTTQKMHTPYHSISFRVHFSLLESSWIGTGQNEGRHDKCPPLTSLCTWWLDVQHQTHVVNQWRHVQNCKWSNYYVNLVYRLEL